MSSLLTYSASCTYVAGVWSTTPVSLSVFESSSFTIPDFPSSLAFECEQAESPAAIMITAIIAVIFFLFILFLLLCLLMFNCYDDYKPVMCHSCKIKKSIAILIIAMDFCHDFTINLFIRISFY